MVMHSYLHTRIYIYYLIIYSYLILYNYNYIYIFIRMYIYIWVARSMYPQNFWEHIDNESEWTIKLARLCTSGTVYGPLPTSQATCTRPCGQFSSFQFSHSPNSSRFPWRWAFGSSWEPGRELLWPASKEFSIRRVHVAKMEKNIEFNTIPGP